MQEKDSGPLTILLVEDDPAIIQLVALGLRMEKFEVITAIDGREGFQLFLEKKPDLLIVDWMLPKMDGITLCRKIRELSDLPIIIITAKDAVQDRVEGLDTGADDYLVKPFHLDELLARVRARLRRRLPISHQLIFSDLSFDLETHEFFRGKRLLHFTATEQKVLELFLRHPRQVLSKETILEKVWGYDFGGDANIVEQYIRSIRQKLGEPNLIQTIRGLGYSLREEQE
ncbi:MULTISPECIES: response regulator transcription factor [Anaerolinea]|uniref:OmpR family two-component response regulator n=1 Tax=Anaerolinea thermophila (strain DSM 14523 / JCM 11388 / NBRC 100420 / UNI-1) TaxID=926569 RepID=E8N549_ANATU|nr:MULTISPECIES: response regulator transcription factor [Anaerolinea]BAJ63563.1 OmpR family two-component response regulator [Anaerolinea thermophila UNI-1]